MYLLLVREISLVVLQIHVDYTIFIFLPLVLALDLLTGHAWSIVELLMSSKLPESVTLRLADDLPFIWDPSPKNQLLPNNQKAKCNWVSLCLAIAAYETHYWAVTRKFYT